MDNRTGRLVGLVGVELWAFLVGLVGRDFMVGLGWPVWWPVCRLQARAGEDVMMMGMRLKMGSGINGTGAAMDDSTEYVLFVCRL